MRRNDCGLRIVDCGLSETETLLAAGNSRDSAALSFVLSILFASLHSASVLAQDTSSADVRAKIILQARSALAEVELYLKIPSDDDATGPSGAGETVASQLQDRQQEQVARERKAIEMMGVIISPRELLVPDTGVDAARIDRWEVIDSAGRRTQVKRTAMLLDAPALVLEPIDEQVQWTVLEFSEAAVDATSTFVVVTPQRVHTEWLLNTSLVRGLTRWVPDKNGDGEAGPFWVVGSISSGVATADAMLGGGPRASAINLIFSTNGQLLGAGVADRIYPGRQVPPWRGVDLRAAPRITQAEWEKIEQRTREGFSAMVYPVRIEYRRPKGGSQALPESELLGWAVSARSLVIPHAIHRSIAAQIAKITVEVGGRELEGRFLGQFKDFDAFMVTLDKDDETLPVHADLKQSGRIQPYRPHIAMTLNRKYGSNDLRIDSTRKLGSTLGYGNRQQPQFVPSPSLGSLVLDLEDKPIGFFARRRRPMEELEPYEQGQATQFRLPQQSGNAELFALADWARALDEPASYFDPHVVRRDEKEQDRRVWLGIEFNPLTRELAESLGCRKESKDGSVGLMISQIYAGSPAEQVGLRTSDVLLTIDVSGRPRPIELSPPRGGRGGGTQDFSQFRGGEAGVGGQGSGRAPWPSRGNYLTNLLGIVGADTTVKLAFWHSGKLEHIEFRIAQAPPDQDSAAQFKDEQLGITVKEVTYEVRAALQMKSNDPGVVVAKIEAGSPAGRARINPYEIVQAADGESLETPAKFEEIVKKAQAEKKEQIRLTVVDRGRSRFADLKLTP